MKRLALLIVSILLISCSFTSCIVIPRSKSFKISEDKVSSIDVYDLREKIHYSDFLRTEEPIHEISEDNLGDFLSDLAKIRFSDNLVIVLAAVDPSFFYDDWTVRINYTNNTYELLSCAGYGETYNENNEVVSTHHFSCDNEEWHTFIKKYVPEDIFEETQKEDIQSNDYMFTYNDTGNLVSKDGVEYSLLGIEASPLHYFGEGEFEFLGRVKGEEETSTHLSSEYKLGLFAIKGVDENNILIRYTPNNEWYSIYRKTSLPPIDLTLENCSRLELIPHKDYRTLPNNHIDCNGGITDNTEMSNFFNDIKKQKDPDEAGLYDLVKNPDGMLEKCYVYGYVCAFFDEEPNITIPLEIISFNDQAYSICVEDKYYVLPTEWFNHFESLCH